MVWKGWRGSGFASAGSTGSAKSGVSEDTTSGVRDEGHLGPSRVPSGGLQLRRAGSPAYQTAGLSREQVEASLRAAASPLNGHAKYQFVKDLDRGTFGFVQKAIDLTTGEEVAIKFMERTQDLGKYVEREIANHRRLKHPHIIQLKEVFITPRHLAIVMEYAGGGNLFKLMSTERQGLSEDDARWYFQQIIVALDYLHQLGMCNRDLKLENTLLSGQGRPLVKLCDFGYSKDVNEHSAAGSMVGTPAYLAPEVVGCQAVAVPYDGRKADIWSSGVLLYALVAADYPFSRNGEDPATAQGMRRIMQRIQAVDFRWPAKELSEPLKDLIERILTRDPEERITLPEIFEHEWFATALPRGVADLNTALLEQQGYGTDSDVEYYEDETESDEEGRDEELEEAP